MATGWLPQERREMGLSERSQQATPTTSNELRLHHQKLCETVRSAERRRGGGGDVRVDLGQGRRDRHLEEGRDQAGEVR
jgi:hypothetical protein